MANSKATPAGIDPDQFLDITGEVCPMTFVKTKLRLERMVSGETLLVRLKGAEPLENVPRSVTEQGDTVISLAAEDGKGTGDPARVHLLLLRKS